MIVNEVVDQYSAEHPEFATLMQNLLPGVSVIEPVDVTEAMVYLCGDSGRYVTGSTLTIDAGILLK
jgi:hypothetical protein